MTITDTPSLSGAEARRAARNAGAIVVARVLSSGALLLWQLILGRLLGDSEFGVYGTVGALFALGASLTAFGTGPIVVRDVARRPDRAGMYLSAALITHTMFGLGAYLILNALGVALGYDGSIRALTAVAAISLFVDLFGNVAYDVLLGRERMVVASGIDVAHIVVRIVLAGIALSLGFGLLGVYVMTIVSGVGRSVAFWIVLRRDNVRAHFPIDGVLVRALIINSAPLAVGALINITYTQIDKLMTTSTLTTADTGHLNAAFVIIAGVVELLSSTVLTAIFPILSRAFVMPFKLTDPANATFRFLIEKLAFFSVLVGLPLSIAITLFASAVAIPLFGADFAPTADLLRVLIWYALVVLVVNVFAQGMMAQNRQRRLLIVRFGGLGLKLSLNIFLLPRVGVIGAGIASVCAELVVLALLIGDYRALQLQRHLLGRLARTALAGVVAAAVMWVVGAINPVVGLIVGGLAYIVALIGVRALAKDDLDLLYRLVAAAPGGRVILKYWKRDVVLNW